MRTVTFVVTLSVKIDRFVVRTTVPTIFKVALSTFHIVQLMANIGSMMWREDTNYKVSIMISDVFDAAFRAPLVVLSGTFCRTFFTSRGVGPYLWNLRGHQLPWCQAEKVTSLPEAGSVFCDNLRPSGLFPGTMYATDQKGLIWCFWRNTAGGNGSKWLGCLSLSTLSPLTQGLFWRPRLGHVGTFCMR